MKYINSYKRKAFQRFADRGWTFENVLDKISEKLIKIIIGKLPKKEFASEYPWKISNGSLGGTTGIIDVGLCGFKH